MTEATAKEPANEVRQHLAADLAAVARRLEPAVAIVLLTEALAKAEDGRDELAAVIIALAGRLEPAEAVWLLTQSLAWDRDSSTCMVPAGSLATQAPFEAIASHGVDGVPHETSQARFYTSAAVLQAMQNVGSVARAAGWGSAPKTTFWKSTAGSALRRFQRHADVR